MSQTAHNPHPLVSAAAEVAAERFGMPILDEDRSRLIAALHVLINWLIDHPGIPVANSVSLTHNPAIARTRITSDQLHTLAIDQVGQLGKTELHDWVTLDIADRREHGADILLHVFAGDYADRDRPL